MKKRVTTINAAAKTRLAAIEAYQKGDTTLQEVGERFGVDKTTIRAWLLMYENGGIEALKTYMKPRPKHVLPLADLERDHQADPDNEVIASLLDLARGGRLDETAAKWGITAQGLAKRRRLYLAEKEKARE